MQATIELSDVGQGFTLQQQSITLFSGVNLRLHSGESTAVVGPSGIGKSSLLLLMAGLETPQSGQVRYYHDGSQQALSQLRKDCGFVFQQFHLLPELSALHNLALPLKLRGEKQAMAKAKDWLKRVGLGERQDHKPSQLSGGEQQRVAIARAFIGEPKFVFADEPTGNLDPDTAEGIANLMFDCAKEYGAGMVFVTHNRELASKADHSLHLSRQGLESQSQRQVA